MELGFFVLMFVVSVVILSLYYDMRKDFCSEYRLLEAVIPLIVIVIIWIVVINMAGPISGTKEALALQTERATKEFEESVTIQKDSPQIIIEFRKLNTLLPYLKEWEIVSLNRDKWGYTVVLQRREK